MDQADLYKKNYQGLICHLTIAYEWFVKETGWFSL